MCGKYLIFKLGERECKILVTFSFGRWSSSETLYQMSPYSLTIFNTASNGVTIFIRPYYAFCTHNFQGTSVHNESTTNPIELKPSHIL